MMIYTNNFQVVIPGITATFTSVSGLKVSIPKNETTTGSARWKTWRPGTPTPDKVVLRREFVPEDALWNWFKQAYEGLIPQKNIEIKLLDNAGKPVQTIMLLGCLPRKWNHIQEGNEMFDEIELSVPRLELR